MAIFFFLNVLSLGLNSDSFFTLEYSIIFFFYIIPACVYISTPPPRRNHKFVSKKKCLDIADFVFFKFPFKPPKMIKFKFSN